MIEGVTADSRKVKPGCLFAALPGAKADGRDFVPAALAAGAAAVIGRGAGRRPARRWSRSAMRAAPTPWPPPPSGARSRQICVAVTGTNGKTSVATFCRQIFERLGHASASMGTLGVRAGGEQITPPGPDHARRRRRRARCWPTWPAAASPTWRWKPRRTASTSAASTA